MTRIAIIGAGAAGCFCAIRLGQTLADTEIDVFEAGQKPLAKVAITGGGRCNLTNSFAGITSLAKAYPRGEKVMKRALKRLSNGDVCKWFEDNGVRLVTQEDNCVFPKSQDAMEIVHTLERLMRENGVRVHCCRKVSKISHTADGYKIEFEGSLSPAIADKVVVTTGGCSRSDGPSFLENLHLPIEKPVPSLFTFCVKGQGITDLMGNVTENVITSIPGTSFKAEGPLLITDWGMSGPAILKLSSYAARYLSDNEYKAKIAVNWLGRQENEVRERLADMAAAGKAKQMSSTRPEGLTGKLWALLLGRSSLRGDIRWTEIGSKGINRLVSTLTNDIYDITGKGSFKEEFVTCGGISLSGVDLNTLESKDHKGLFLAGEVLDIDAITGGFNLQAAWSTGYTVAEAIIKGNG